MSHTESLCEFGKHLNQEKPKPPAAAQHVTSDLSSSSEAGPSGDAFDDLFSEEFAAEAEAQLNEAMEMLASENPELWQQFESFARSMGMDSGPGGGASQSQATPSTSGVASQGETSVDEGASKERGGAANLDQQLEETLKRLRETTEQIEVSFLSKNCFLFYWRTVPPSPSPSPSHLSPPTHTLPTISIGL